MKKKTKLKVHRVRQEDLLYWVYPGDRPPPRTWMLDDLSWGSPAAYRAMLALLRRGK